MPKARKRKAPITSIDNTDTSSSKPQSSRTLIRLFHVLLKKQAQLEKSTPNPANEKALADVEVQIDRLGGLGAYQRMSSIGQGTDRGGGSEKILIDWLKELGVSGRSAHRATKLSLLEVGALKPNNYQSCSSWIDATPMDLRSRHPSIMEQDFLLMNAAEHCEKWDIISLSLVLNFVPEPKDRGRMLSLAYKMLSPGGHLFLALPLPCVTNSRYLTFEHLKALMSSIGFVQLKDKWKAGGKMAYWLFRKGDECSALNIFEKKTVLRQGNRNNFSILL